MHICTYNGYTKVKFVYCKYINIGKMYEQFSEKGKNKIVLSFPVSSVFLAHKQKHTFNEHNILDFFMPIMTIVKILLIHLISVFMHIVVT